MDRPKQRPDKTSIWVSKLLRDRLGERVKWPQSLADVIADLLEKADCYDEMVSDRGDQSKRPASARLLASAT